MISAPSKWVFVRKSIGPIISTKFSRFLQNRVLKYLQPSWIFYLNNYFCEQFQEGQKPIEEGHWFNKINLLLRMIEAHCLRNTAIWVRPLWNRRPILFGAFLLIIQTKTLEKRSWQRLQKSIAFGFLWERVKQRLLKTMTWNIPSPLFTFLGVLMWMIGENWTHQRYTFSNENVR